MRNQSPLSLVVTRALVAGCLVAPLLVAAPRAQAQNLVANPGFESGLAGWTATGNVSASTYADQIANQGLTGNTAPFGAGLAIFNGGQTAPTGMLSQTLITAPLTTYTLSFEFGAYASQPNRTQSIIARAVDSVTGVVLSSLALTDAPPGGDTNIDSIFSDRRSLSFTTITGTGTRIEFLDQAGNTTDRSDGYLDSVSVTAAVPEPSAGLLLLATLPLAGVVVARRRKMVRAAF